MVLINGELLWKPRSRSPPDAGRAWKMLPYSSLSTPAGMNADHGMTAQRVAAAFKAERSCFMRHCYRRYCRYTFRVLKPGDAPHDNAHIVTIVAVSGVIGGVSLN